MLASMGRGASRRTLRNFDDESSAVKIKLNGQEINAVTIDTAEMREGSLEPAILQCWYK